MVDVVTLWPIIAAAGAVIFGAGVLVSRIKNNRYVSTQICGERMQATRELIDARLDRIEDHLTFLRNYIESTADQARERKGK
jgi:predicted mannosyl-3-phosphoglycerate phosphatase (HAD superfamily)